MEHWWSGTEGLSVSIRQDGPLVLGFVLGTLALYGLDRYPAGLLIQFVADTKPGGICSGWAQGRVVSREIAVD